MEHPGMQPTTTFVPTMSWALLLELANAAEAASFAHELRSSIAQLPPLQRSVLLADLDAGGQVAARELALHLGTSPNSVYVSRSNGRRALYAALERGGVRVLASPA
jgi:DNA-directed RNA polymerase specialized sigma24 family protein